MSYKKKLGLITLILALGLGLISCSQKPEEDKKVTVVEKKNVLKTILNVDGMTCESCESIIQKNVGEIEGVVNVKVSHIKKTTIVEYDQTQTSEAEITKTISQIGYKIFEESRKKVTKEISQSMKCGAGKCGHSQ